MIKPIDNKSEGLAQLASSTIAICGLARNCDSKLAENICFIENLNAYFRESIVVVVENDSSDSTREILNNWAASSQNVRVLNGDIQKEKHETKEVGVNNPNPYYSRARISRMASLRNQYLDYLNRTSQSFDFLLILDFDVDRISLPGVLNSLSRHKEWDVVTAYGYSVGPSFRERYHDTYALVPLEEQDNSQNEASIKALQLPWKLSKKDSVLKKVYAAYGGLSIYKYTQIDSLRYQVLPNQDSKVEARCEHFSICEQLQKTNHAQIMINPLMHLRYQSIWEGVKTFFSGFSLIR